MLLNDEEFRPIEHALSRIQRDIKSYRKRNGVFDIKTEMKESKEGQLVLLLCEELTGIRPYHPLGADCLKLSKYGSLCPKCEIPRRTPRARLCVECGYELPEGEVAGPLTDG